MALDEAAQTGLASDADLACRGFKNVAMFMYSEQCTPQLLLHKVRANKAQFAQLGASRHGAMVSEFDVRLHIHYLSAHMCLKMSA